MEYDILHTADWHLWHKHKYTKFIPGKHWDAMFEAQIEILKDVFIHFVKDNEVSYFIIAGDIFHHYNPIEPVRREFVKLINDISSFVKRVYVFLGNHDVYKDQYSLEAVKEAMFGNIVIFYKPATIEINNNKVRIDHCSVRSFEAREGYYENPDKIIDPEYFKNEELVLLGHYHKQQSNNKIFYSGSPYPIDFGEENETKYFMTYNLGNGIIYKKHPFSTIQFLTNPAIGIFNNDEYYVVRLKKECKSSEEKIIRQKLLESKVAWLNQEKCLDCIINIEVKKENIDGNKINKKGKKITHIDMIEKLDIGEDFKKYICRKFSEVHPNAY